MIGQPMALAPPPWVRACWDRLKSVQRSVSAALSLKSAELSPLLETETRNLLKARPVRSHDGCLPFFEHLSLTDQRVVRITMTNDRRVLACGGRRRQQRAQRSISSRAPHGIGTAVSCGRRFLGGPEGKHRSLDRSAERACQHGADRNVE